MTYDRRRDLPSLLGHRVLILDHQEVLEALEMAVGASLAKRAAGHRDHCATRHRRLRAALRRERELQAGI